MSSIQFGCPLCGAIAEIDGSMAGRQTNCPGCGTGVLVPAAGQSTIGLPPIIERPPPPSRPAPPVPPGAVAGQPAIISGPPPVAFGPPSLVDAANVQTSPVSRTGSAAPGEAVPVEPGAASSGRTASPERPSPVRRLTPEERALRRFRRNIVMASLGLAILMITLAVLLRFSG